MVSNCFKVTMYGGFALAAINLVANIVAFVDFGMTIDDYNNNAIAIADDLIEDPSSSFNATSPWFTAISEEYDYLSNFDKSNVYCKVKAIQSSPDEYYTEGQMTWVLCFVFILSSAIAFVIVIASFCCKIHRGGFDTFDLSNVAGIDAENPSIVGKQKLQKLQRDWETLPPKADQEKENMWQFRASSVILFVSTGPFLAYVWMMITGYNQLSGYACQQMFYDCGNSGNCDMDDLMVPVALNSSVLALSLADPLLAVGLFSGVLNLLFVLVSGAILFLRSLDFLNFILFPVFQLIFGVLPLAWVYFLEESAPIGAFGIALLSMTPLVIFMIAIGIECCRSR